MRLKDKTAIVTGGSSGIGRATALAFASHGAKVAIGDIQDGTDIVDEIVNNGGEAYFARTDVTKATEIQKLVQDVKARWGSLDIAFFNAGIGMAKPIDEVSEEEFDLVFDVNVKGVFLGCKFALPIMLNQGGGSIINMSSNGGLIGRSTDPVYTATKHAVMGLTKALALTYASQNVRVNAVCPGPIDTPIIWGGQESSEEKEQIARMVLATCPAARFAEPAEVADAVVFLASDESRFISGIGLPVDGAKAAGTMPIDRYRLDFDILAS